MAFVSSSFVRFESSLFFPLDVIENVENDVVPTLLKMLKHEAMRERVEGYIAICIASIRFKNDSFS